MELKLLFCFLVINVILELHQTTVTCKSEKKYSEGAIRKKDNKGAYEIRHKNDVEEKHFMKDNFRFRIGPAKSLSKIDYRKSKLTKPTHANKYSKQIKTRPVTEISKIEYKKSKPKEQPITSKISKGIKTGPAKKKNKIDYKKSKLKKQSHANKYSEDIKTGPATEKVKTDYKKSKPKTHHYANEHSKGIKIGSTKYNRKADDKKYKLKKQLYAKKNSKGTKTGPATEKGKIDYKKSKPKTRHYANEHSKGIKESRLQEGAGLKPTVLKPLREAGENNSRKRLQKAQKKIRSLKKEMQRLKQSVRSSEDAAEIIALKERLRQQNTRHEQIWSALRGICQALDEDTHNHTDVDRQDMVPTPNPPSSVNEFRIKLVSLRSEIIDPATNLTNITVEYTTQGQPTAVWNFQFNGGAFYTTNGWTKYQKREKTYISYISLDNYLLDSLAISVRLVSEQDSLWLSFNPPSIMKSMYETFSPMDFSIECPSMPITASYDNNWSISFHLNGNVNKLENFFARLIGMDSSVNPTRVIFLSSNLSKNFTLSVNRTSSNHVHLRLNSSAEQIAHGGLLYLLLNTQRGKSDFYEDLSFARSFGVISRNTSTVFPPNSPYLNEQKDKITLSRAYQTINCIAFGSPRPNVALFRTHGNTEEELVPETVVKLNKFTTEKAYTVYANDSRVEGKYDCRAWHNGAESESVNVTTEVVIYEEPRIDQSATGVVTNSSDKIEISCQATGQPAPAVELRLYSVGGPDLAGSAKYKAMKTSPDSRTARLVVTISPMDTDIFLVYCYAGRHASVPIQVFPEEGKAENWELYEFLLNNAHRHHARKKAFLSHARQGKPKLNMNTFTII